MRFRLFLSGSLLLLPGLLPYYIPSFLLPPKILTALVFNHHAWLLFILSPVCFVLAWWLVQRFSPYAQGQRHTAGNGRDTDIIAQKQAI